MSVLNNITKCTCGLTCFTRTPFVNSVNLQFVRFRKPRWVPKAKSKIFVVRKPTQIDPVEHEMLLQWTRVYNTEMKSLRAYLVDYTRNINAKRSSDIQRETLTWDYKFSQMKKRNDKWNKEVAKVREGEEQERLKVDTLKQQKIEERDTRERGEMKERARQRILQVAESSSEYIAEEDLDNEIEKLLNTRVSYEFALNPDGTILASEDFEAQENERVNESKTQVIKKTPLPKT